MDLGHALRCRCRAGPSGAAPASTTWKAAPATPAPTAALAWRRRRAPLLLRAETSAAATVGSAPTRVPRAPAPTAAAATRTSRLRLRARLWARGAGSGSPRRRGRIAGGPAHGLRQGDWRFPFAASFGTAGGRGLGQRCALAGPRADAVALARILGLACWQGQEPSVHALPDALNNEDAGRSRDSPR